MVGFVEVSTTHCASALLWCSLSTRSVCTLPPAGNVFRFEATNSLRGVMSNVLDTEMVAQGSPHFLSFLSSSSFSSSSSAPHILPRLLPYTPHSSFRMKGLRTNRKPRVGRLGRRADTLGFELVFMTTNSSWRRHAR